jgi:hypothetical protein
MSSEQPAPYRLVPLAYFMRQAKRLSKKYPSLRHELDMLGQQLALEPTQGAPLGQGVYKVRLAIVSKGKGKSGGARVITLVLHLEQTLYLLSIYDKSDAEDIEQADLQQLIAQARELAAQHNA